MNREWNVEVVDDQRRQAVREVHGLFLLRDKASLHEPLNRSCRALRLEVYRDRFEGVPLGSTQAVTWVLDRHCSVPPLKPSEGPQGASPKSSPGHLCACETFTWKPNQI